MPRAIPILLIIGLALYSFFDVLSTRDLRIRGTSKSVWLVISLIPAIGAALWFLLGRPARSKSKMPPPRVITLRTRPRPVAPDDDDAFLRRIDEQTWRRKRDRQRSQPVADPEADGKNPGAAADGPSPEPGPEDPTPEGKASA